MTTDRLHASLEQLAARGVIEGWNHYTDGGRWIIWGRYWDRRYTDAEIRVFTHAAHAALEATPAGIGRTVATLV